MHNRTKGKSGAWFQGGHGVGVLLNLEKGNPNFNNVGLFKDGVRVSQPVPRPKNMQGKALSRM